MRFAFLLSLVACAAACSTTLDATDYDTSCAGPTDCITLPMGDVCDCSCGQGAIDKSAVDAYNKDRTHIGECSRLCGPCPELQGATCTAGRCALAAKVPADAGKDYTRRGAQSGRNYMARRVLQASGGFVGLPSS